VTAYRPKCLYLLAFPHQSHVLRLSEDFFLFSLPKQKPHICIIVVTVVVFVVVGFAFPFTNHSISRSLFLLVKPQKTIQAFSNLVLIL
jgi:hypothetical protein